MEDLTDKHVLITGGSSGIGLALVDGFAKAGATVAFTHTRAASLERPTMRELLDRYAHVHPLQAEFSDPEVAEHVLSRAIARLGEVDVLINNAAVFSRDALLETAAPTLRRLLDINVTAPFLLTAAFAQHRCAQRLPGSVVHISSLSARRARSRMAAYQCSKAALEMLSTSAAYELAEHCIRSNVIAPGLVETPANATQRSDHAARWLARLADIPFRRAGLPTDLVGAALFLASDDSAWMTGATLVIDGGASTF